jgi:hypothetical protein
LMFNHSHSLLYWAMSGIPFGKPGPPGIAGKSGA